MAAKHLAKASQSQEQQLYDYIRHVRREPVWFCEEILQHKQLPGELTLDEAPHKSWELDQFSKDVLEAVCDVWRKKRGIPTRINHQGVNQITVRSPHGSGKTHTAALVAHWFNTAFPGRIVCTAPKLEQLRSRVWGSLRKVDARAIQAHRATHVINDTAVYWYQVNDQGKVVENKNWCILAETASHPESLAGHHERFQLVIVEEATGVSEALYPVVFGALSTGELQVLLLISNPTKRTGTFGASHLSAKEAPNWFRYHVNLKNSKRIDRAYVAKMETKYGKDSPVVAVRCYGDFPTDDPRQLISYAWIADAQAREFDSTVGDGSLPRTRIVVDVADGGEDETVVTAGKRFQSMRYFAKQRAYSFPSGFSPIMAADAAEAMWKEMGCDAARGDDIVVDSLGVGAGTAGELARRNYPVIRYVGGSASDDTARWRNRRTQSYLVLRDEFRDGRITIAEDFCEGPDEMDELVAQLCTIQTKPTDRLEDLLTKEEMRDKGVKSPDRADTLAMFYATQAPMSLTNNPKAPGAQHEVMPEFIIHQHNYFSGYEDLNGGSR